MCIYHTHPVFYPLEFDISMNPPQNLWEAQCLLMQLDPLRCLALRARNVIMIICKQGCMAQTHNVCNTKTRPR